MTQTPPAADGGLSEARAPSNRAVELVHATSEAAFSYGDSGHPHDATHREAEASLLAFIADLEARAEASKAEAVAWMVRNDHGYWYSTVNKALADTWRNPEGLDVVPLYREPPSPKAEPNQSAVKAENERLRAMLERLRKSAALLQQNAEGCAVNHYGEDFSLFGMPGWLADTRSDIEAAIAALSHRQEGEA